MSTDFPEILALIPARGGSKGVPRKNILSMLGRPLIAWSIHHAQKSKHVTRIIVSTDDEEIAQVATEWGAEVPFIRPPDLAQDLSTDIEVFQHALQWLKDTEGYNPDLVVHLRPTGPARRIAKVDEAIEVMLAHPAADSLRSVSLATQTPFKMWFLDDEFMHPVASLEGVKDSHSLPRQMLPKAYWQNGYVDITRPHTVLEKKSMVGDNPLPYVVDEIVHDVDYPENIPDVEMALKEILDGKEAEPVVSSMQDRFPV